MHFYQNIFNLKNISSNFGFVSLSGNICLTQLRRRATPAPSRFEAIPVETSSLELTTPFFTPNYIPVIFPIIFRAPVSYCSGFQLPSIHLQTILIRRKIGLMGHRRKPLWMCTMYVRTLALVLIEEYQYQYVTVS